MRVHVRDVAAPRGADRPLRALRPDDDLDRPVRRRCRGAARGRVAWRRAVLPAPFRWEGEHIAADLPGGRVLFSTRRGGVSAGPFESLNLGRLTADDGANVDANRERLAAAVGLPRERFIYGRQVHGATVRRATEPPGPARPAVEEDGQATALDGRRGARVRRRLPAGDARRRRRRGRAALRLARARGRDRRRGRRGAARARRRRPGDRRDRARRARLLLRGQRGGPGGVRRRARRARRASATSTCRRSRATSSSRPASRRSTTPACARSARRAAVLLAPPRRRA